MIQTFNELGALRAQIAQWKGEGLRVALVPTILVAIFAVLNLNIGLEGWFSDRVRSVVGTSLSAAEAYEKQSREDLLQDATALAAYLNVAKQSTFFLRDDQLRPLLTQGQTAVQRGLKEAFLIDGVGTLMTRGERSYLFDFEQPSQAPLDAAREQGPQVVEDWANNEFRALVHLEAYADRYLYVSREVDGELQTTALQIEDGAITAIYVMRNPDKLTGIASTLG